MYVCMVTGAEGGGPTITSTTTTTTILPGMFNHHDDNDGGEVGEEEFAGSMHMYNELRESINHLQVCR